jgi:hypothetical protein
MNDTVSDGAATPASNQPHVTQDCFNALVGEIYERINLLESRLDDHERTRDGMDRRASALLERRSQRHIRKIESAWNAYLD